MIGATNLRVLPSALVALILVSTSRAGTIDFGFYPKSAQECMYAAADTSKCESSTVSATNACLCRNGGNFVTNTASCLGKSSPRDVETVYTTMEDACRNSNTPLSVSKSEFMSAASAAQSTSPSPTPSTPPEQKDENDEKDNSMSTGLLGGIIGGAIGGAAMLGAVAFFIWKKRRGQGEESHPMLPYQQPSQPGHMSLLPTMGDGSAGYSSPPSTGVWQPKEEPKWMSSTYPAAYRASGFNWESPHELVYDPEAHVPEKNQSAYQPPPPIPASTPAFAVAELDSTSVQPAAINETLVEMPGSTPDQPRVHSSNIGPNPRLSGQHGVESGWGRSSNSS